MFCLFFVSTSFEVVSQSILKMDLSAYDLTIEDRMFFINGVKDQRNESESIGSAVVRIDSMVRWQEVQFDPSLQEYLLDFFSTKLPDQNIGQVGITIIINDFSVKDLISDQDTVANLNLDVDYYFGATKIFSDQRSTKQVSDIRSLTSHEQNVVVAIRESLIAFDTFDWPSAILNQNIQIQPKPSNHQESQLQGVQGETDKNETLKYDEPKESFEIEESNGIYGVEKKNRNTIAVGYQIGGLTLVGVDYEFRIHDHFGVHGGGGFSGYTAGVKIHFSPEKNSSFINVSYKDGGFGLISVLAAEYGGKWVFSKNSDFGMLYQVGLASIQYIDNDFEQQFFDGEAPPIILSIGVGFCW